MKKILLGIVFGGALLMSGCTSAMKPDRGRKDAFLKKGSFLETVKRFKEKSKEFRPQKLWSEWDGYKYRTKYGKHMFAQKNLVPSGSVIKFLADIHGDPKALKDFLRGLQNDGWISKENPYKIIKKDGKELYLVFLGDYIDIKMEGGEVLEIAMSLFNESPKNTLLIRGNHERESLIKHDEEGRELIGGSEFEKELRESYGMEKSERKKVYSAFNYMIGRSLLYWKDKSGKRVAVFLGHNGTDHEFPFAKFLSDKKVKFQFGPTTEDGEDEWKANLAQYVLDEDGPNELNPLEINRETLGKIFTENFNVEKDSEEKKEAYEFIGAFLGHYHGWFEETFKKGNGVHFFQEQKQWDLEGGDKSRYLKDIINRDKDGKVVGPFIGALGRFSYGEYNGEKNVLPVITLHTANDFNECKLSRTFLEGK